MYSKQEIAYLMKSGFSMTEIMALDNPSHENPAPAPAPDPAPAPAPAPAPDPAPAPAPAPAPDPAPAPAPAGENAVLAAIENLTKTIQASNIRAGGFPAPDSGNSAETILANIINPPGYTGKKE